MSRCPSQDWDAYCRAQEPRDAEPDPWPAHDCREHFVDYERRVWCDLCQRYATADEAAHYFTTKETTT